MGQHKKVIMEFSEILVLHNCSKCNDKEYREFGDILVCT